MKNPKPEGHEYSDDCTCPYCEEIRQRFNKLGKMLAEHNIIPLVVDPENDPRWAGKITTRVCDEVAKIRTSK